MMNIPVLGRIAALALIMVPGSLYAQATQDFNFSYTGKVTSSPSAGAKLNSGEPWPSNSVALPSYAFEVGSVFEIAFSGIMPVLEGLAPGADGLIRTSLLGSLSDPNLQGARINNVTIGGLSGDRQAPGQFGIQDADIIYNPTTREYSLDVRDGSLGAVNLPDYIVTEDSSGVFSVKLRETPDTESGYGLSKARVVNNELVFDGTNISFGKPDTKVGSAGSLNIAGSLGKLSIGGGGAPTPVPEPASMLLFGGGAALLLRKRAKPAK